MTGRRAALATAVALLTVATPRAADRSLLDVVGTVSAIVVSQDEGGASWVDAIVSNGSRGTVRIRLAPPDALRQEGFLLRNGDSVRARVFGDEDPHGVHRISNESTGASIRLRCLHGDPLWGARVHGGRRWRGGRTGS